MLFVEQSGAKRSYFKLCNGCDVCPFKIVPLFTYEEKINLMIHNVSRARDIYRQYLNVY